MNELENVVVESTENAVETVAKRGLNWKVIGLVAGGTILTGGLVYLGIRFFNKRKAAKANVQATEVVAEEAAQN